MFYATPSLYAVKMRKAYRRNPARNCNATHYASVVCRQMSIDTAYQCHNWAWMRDTF